MSAKNKMDMSNEKAPRHLFKEGDHHFEVMDVRKKMSKAQNEMYVATLQELETGHGEDVYMVAVEGKRWLLKSFLDACGITPDKDASNNYEWEENDCVGQIVTATIVHEANEYIDRSGETRKGTQACVKSFKKYEKPAQEKTTWEEEDAK